MSMIVGTALVRILPSTLGFSSALSSSMSKEAKAFQRAGDAMSLAISGPILAAFGGAAKSAINFETAFTGVRKTVNATEGEFATLKQGIVDMANRMPATREQIAAVVEAAGRFGVANKDLLSFTETAVKLGVSTNLSADQAAESLTRFANIVHLPADQFKNLASSIVALGNDFPTTEAEIANFAKRMGGAGSVVQANTASIVGLAAALPSLGLRQEAAGTAFTRIILNMQSAVLGGGKSLQKFSAIAGVSAQQFADSFRKDPVQAMIGFIGGVKRLQDSGKDVAGILKDAGLGEIRVRDTILRSAQNVDLLTRAVNMSNQAWGQNNALDIEAEKRFKTTASQMEIFKNNVSNIGRVLGETLLPQINKVMEQLRPFLDLLTKLAEGYAKLDPRLQTIITDTLLFIAAIGPVISIGTRLYHAFQLVAGGISLVADVMAANPIILALLAIAAAGYLIYRNWDSIKKLFSKEVAPAVKAGSAAVAKAADAAVGGVEKAIDKAKKFSFEDAIFGKKGSGADKALLIARTAAKAADQYKAAAEAAAAQGDTKSAQELQDKATQNYMLAKSAADQYEKLSRKRSGGLMGQVRDFMSALTNRGFEDQAAGITGSIGGFLGQKTEGLINGAKQLGSNIISGISDGISAGAGAVSGAIGVAVQSTTQALATTVYTVGSTVGGAFLDGYRTVAGTLPGWVSDLVGTVSQVWGTAFDVARSVFSAFLTFVEPIMQAIWNAIVVRIQLLQAILPPIWNAIWDALTFVFRNFYALFLQTWDQLQQAFSLGVTFISNVLNMLWSIVQTVWQQIVFNISGAVDLIGNILSRVRGPILAVIQWWNDLFNQGSDIFGKIMKALGDFAGWVVDKVHWMATQVHHEIDQMLGPLGKVAEIGGNIIGGAVDIATGGFLRRASGGPVLAGRDYIVGEKGPELLRMGSRSGQVVPNGALGGASVFNAPLVYVAQVVLDPKGEDTLQVSRRLARDTEVAMRAKGLQTTTAVR